MVWIFLAGTTDPLMAKITLIFFLHIENFNCNFEVIRGKIWNDYFILFFLGVPQLTQEFQVIGVWQLYTRNFKSFQVKLMAWWLFLWFSRIGLCVGFALYTTLCLGRGGDGCHSVKDCHIVTDKYIKNLSHKKILSLRIESILRNCEQKLEYSY